MIDIVFLKKPIDKVEDVFKACISNTRNANYKKKLDNSLKSIILASEDFSKKVNTHTTYTIAEHKTIGGLVSASAMVRVYGKMVKKESKGRKYYDKYILLAKNSFCPLCGHNIVSTLDHYMPKQKFPSLAVTPINLVPSCKDCNFVKKTMSAINSEHETLHPYFDNIEDEIWLDAKIIEQEPIAFEFQVIRPPSWNDLLFERVKNHFEIFNINKLYSPQAARESVAIKRRLQRLYRSTDEENVREHLKEAINDYELSNKNSWCSAMYRSMYRCDWVYKTWIK